MVWVGFRDGGLNGVQWLVGAIMSVLGAAEVLAEQILNPLPLSRRRELKSTHFYSAFSFFVVPFSLLQNICNSLFFHGCNVAVPLLKPNLFALIAELNGLPKITDIRAVA